MWDSSFIFSYHKKDCATIPFRGLLKCPISSSSLPIKLLWDASRKYLGVMLSARSNSFDTVCPIMTHFLFQGVLVHAHFSICPSVYLGNTDIRNLTLDAAVPFLALKSKHLRFTAKHKHWRPKHIVKI